MASSTFYFDVDAPIKAEGAVPSEFGSQGIKADVIAEDTSGAGVTVDGLLIKDGGLTVAGAQDLNGYELILDADADTSITADTDDQIDVKIAGADDFRFVANVFRALSGSSVEADTINETTAAAGVTVDGTLLKDGGVSTADAGSVTTNTIAEKTATSGVTVDGCLIKDGRAAALATASMFLSAEVTGNGSEQDTAHGFGSTPSLVYAIPSDLTGGAYTVAYGTHDTTNCKVTVTTGEKYRVVAFK